MGSGAGGKKSEPRRRARRYIFPVVFAFALRLLLIGHFRRTKGPKDYVVREINMFNKFAIT